MTATLREITCGHPFLLKPCIYRQGLLLYLLFRFLRWSFTPPALCDPFMPHILSCSRQILS